MHKFSPQYPHPKITFSVIIPTFNSAETIIQCIESVRNQTIPALEIIVIDDCSDDKTAELILKMAEEEPRIILLRNEINLGPASARNRGLDVAKGSHVAFLDSDDFWLPSHLKIAHDLLMTDSQHQVVSHRPYSVSEASQWAAHQDAPRTRDLSLLSMILFQGDFSTISVVAPTSLVISAGGFNASRRYAEDLELFLKMRLKCRRWIAVLAPRTAVVGKHFFASKKGLSARHFKMFIGSQLAISNALNGTWMALLLPTFWVWFSLKYLRRLIMIYGRSIESK